MLLIAFGVMIVIATIMIGLTFANVRSSSTAIDRLTWLILMICGFIGCGMIWVGILKALGSIFA